jgi:hypothetical protein
MERPVGKTLHDASAGGQVPTTVTDAHQATGVSAVKRGEFQACGGFTART